MAVRRALISVFDKTGLDRFATGLSELGVELMRRNTRGISYT